MKLYILLALSVAALMGQAKDTSPRYPGSYTVATLPAAASWSGYVAVVTDASFAGSCTVGGGSAKSLCRSTGAAWESIGGSSLTAGATGALTISSGVIDIDTAYPFVSVVGPYTVAGSSYYLPFGFQATLPPTTGWTGRNFIGSASFATSGLGGAIAITSNTTNDSLNIQGRAVGSTTVLTAAIAGYGNAAGTNLLRCGIGIQRPAGTLGTADLGLKSFGNGGGMGGYRWTNPTTPVAAFGSMTGIGIVWPVIYYRITLSGGNVVVAISPTGQDFVTIGSDTQTNVLGGAVASTDEWILFASGDGTNSMRCNLLSWSTT